jgi:hypothetical protein
VPNKLDAAFQTLAREWVDLGLVTQNAIFRRKRRSLALPDGNITNVSSECGT